MKNEIFTVLDQAMERFMEPFFAVTVRDALRGFGDVCVTEGHQFQKFPEDYALYHIGEFNPETGELKPMKPRKVANATNYVQPQFRPEVVENA